MVIHGSISISIPNERNLSFFWGGSASRRVGPGRTHMGYYVRWHMLEQWAKAPAAFDEQAGTTPLPPPSPTPTPSTHLAHPLTILPRLLS